MAEIYTSDVRKANGSACDIYDPNRSGGKTVLDAAKGSFRFSTAAQGGNRNYQVNTPYETLGIRG